MLEFALPLGLTVPAVAAAMYLPPFLTRRCQEARLRRRCAQERVLALTFDDGPGEDLTPRVLDLLRERGVRATFFLAGFRAQAYPAIVDRIAAEGHEIGCHSHAHLDSWRVAPWRAVEDINRGFTSLGKWIAPDGLFRPPHGRMTMLTWASIRRRGADLAWWTVSAGDVEDPLPSATRALDAAVRNQGGVVLLHDFDRGPERTRYVLDVTTMLLDAAEQHGWTTRRLGDLFSHGAKNAA